MMDEFETVKLGCGHSIHRKRTPNSPLQVRCPACGKWSQFVAIVVRPDPRSFTLPGPARLPTVRIGR